MRELKDENMLMTCAVVSNWLNYSSDWQRYFDYINVMSYDHDSFTSTPVQHASYDHFVSDLNYWVNQYGTPKTKLSEGFHSMDTHGTKECNQMQFVAFVFME